MNILALDTSTEVAGIAFLADEKVRFSHTFLHRMNLSQRLLPAVRWLLRDSGLTLHDVDALAVGLGPGSFTGVRTGVTTAKILAQVTGLPVVGVGTLEVMAAAINSCYNLHVCPAIDARKQEVYTALYRMSPQGPEQVMAPQAMDAPTLADTLHRRQEPILVIGTGALRYQALLAEHFRYEPGHDFPDPVMLALLGQRRLERGEHDDPLTLNPLYVRPSEAERNAARAAAAAAP